MTRIPASLWHDRMKSQMYFLIGVSQRTVYRPVTGNVTSSSLYTVAVLPVALRYVL